MPSSSHEILYRRLQGITADARTALAENDFEKLPEIIELQQMAMADLDEAGDCRDAGLLSLVTHIRDDVRHAEQEIGGKSAEIRAVLNVMANKRKITKAYGA